MYCDKCGKELKKTDKFCDQCGNVISLVDPLNDHIATIFYIIAFAIGVFVTGIIGIFRFGLEIMFYTPIWLPLLLFVIGLAIVIFTKIKYHTNNSTLILVLYIIFGLINIIIYYLIIGTFVAIIKAFFSI